MHKSPNVTVLMYRLVFRAKDRRVVFDEEIDDVLQEVCLRIEQRNEVTFLGIGSDNDHCHWVVQSDPSYSVKASEIFKHCPQVTKQLWGGEFGLTGILRAKWENT